MLPGSGYLEGKGYEIYTRPERESAGKVNRY